MYTNHKCLVTQQWKHVHSKSEFIQSTFFFGVLEKMKHELQSGDRTADTSHLI
jgi:hypothetical protein